MASLGPGAFARAKSNPGCQVWLGNWPAAMTEEDGKLFLLQEPLFRGCPQRDTRPTPRTKLPARLPACLPAFVRGHS